MGKDPDCHECLHANKRERDVDLEVGEAPAPVVAEHADDPAAMPTAVSGEST